MVLTVHRTDNDVTKSLLKKLKEEKITNINPYKNCFGAGSKYL